MIGGEAIGGGGRVSIKQENSGITTSTCPLKSEFGPQKKLVVVLLVRVRSTEADSPNPSAYVAEFLQLKKKKKTDKRHRFVFGRRLLTCLGSFE